MTISPSMALFGILFSYEHNPIIFKYLLVFVKENPPARPVCPPAVFPATKQKMLLAILPGIT